jgi:hypothetical protein
VLITWQMIHAPGWSDAGGMIALWTLPIVASIAVIIVNRQPPVGGLRCPYGKLHRHDGDY